MNPAQLLSHFDRISDAPDAISRLRRFILDLAVRGKLVEKDSRDEPASELLRRIEDDVRERKARGGSTEPRNAIDVAIDSLPFSVPPSWRWVRLIEIADVSYGFAFESSRFNSNKVGMPLIRIRDISGTDTQAYYQGEHDPDYVVTKGDYLVGMDGDFNVRKWKGPDALLNQRVMRIKNWRAALVAEFLAIPLQMILDHLHASTSQTTVKHLSAKQVNGIYLPMPPLAEQHRIVAKVDELMALCDRLEATQAERESRRDRLAAASLNRLNNGPDPDAFRDHARFYFNNLPRLTTRTEHIQQLRQAILNLAVRGRLVSQDPNDESAAELLKRIQAEQEELIKSRVLKLGGEESRLDEEDLPCDLPPTWQWTTLKSIIVFGPQNGISPKPSSRSDALRAITLTATTSGKFDPQHFKRVEATIPSDSEFWLRSGDLLFQRGNTREYVGIAAYYSGEPGLFLYPDLMIKVRLSRSVSLRFVHLWTIAPYARAYFSAHATGAQATMPKINQGTLLQLPVPIPPLTEQRRIVAKVDELLALCDKLEAQLTTTQTESRRLLELATRSSSRN